MSLDERKSKILEAIILDYISTAEPVGSRTISKKYDLSISPATIRNEMSDLEEMGYIEQPYTSAGRMPSDQGYRYYVDYIMKKNKLDEAIERLVISSFKGKIDRFDDAIRISMELIAKITRYPSLILAPGSESSSLSMIRMLKVDEKRALLVVITENNQVENIFVDLPYEFKESDLDLLTSVINSKLSGTRISQWNKTIISELYGDLLKQKDVLATVLDSIEDRLNQKKEHRVYLTGIIQMLNEPEFRDVDKVKNILSFFDDKRILEDVLTKNSQIENFQVLIGNENEAKEIKECSLIKRSYSFQGDFQGVMGVLGPKRMDYSNAISLLELISEVLERKK
ncbi:MAG: heat-inducible transcriptional repressor HrcA [Eubacteriales bacterium]|nr:heat-inducible transcriptional repressor HrcA [Eubacteriales bacterium]